MQDLKELSHELGLTEEHIRSYAEEIRKSEMRLAECKRNLDARAKKQYDHDVQSHRVSLANDVQDVLDDYVAELQQAKAEELSALLFQCFTKLSRKGDTIKRIEIAPDDLAVTIYEKGGSITPKTELSVGEKQIYAIALLWALTIASRRPLPFIIDTPLGRLDSDHRRNLVTEFFPKASHQMIVFSTDTEINEIYFGKLKANISRSYHLSFDSVESKTTVDEGYFWDSPKEPGKA
jgi:DNA sulfur modification protein DndD